MFATPHIGHFTADDYDRVYEPAEDSFILLDALEAEYELIKSTEPTVCLEVGCGSGVVSAFISRILENPMMIATDVNLFACSATARTCRLNNTSVDPVNCDLAGPLIQRLVGRVELMVFNPPYVPTTTKELEESQRQHGIGGAWAGGDEGLDVTWRLLPLIPKLLSRGGRFYLVTIVQNKPERLIAQFEELGLTCHMVLQRRAGREHLGVLCAIRHQ